MRVPSEGMGNNDYNGQEIVAACDDLLYVVMEDKHESG